MVSCCAPSGRSGLHDLPLLLTGFGCISFGSPELSLRPVLALVLNLSLCASLTRSLAVAGFVVPFTDTTGLTVIDSRLLARSPPLVSVQVGKDYVVLPFLFDPRGASMVLLVIFGHIVWCCDPSLYSCVFQPQRHR